MKTAGNAVQKIRATKIWGRRAGLLALSLIISVLLIACGGGSAPPAPSTNMPVASQVNTATPAASQSSTTGQDDKPGPEADETNQPDTETGETDEPDVAADETNQSDTAAGEIDELDAAADETSQPDTAAEANNEKPGTEEFGLTEEELVEKIEAVEEMVAKCMGDAGFEYVPVDYDTVRKAMEAHQNPPGFTEREFRAQFGYAISIKRTGTDTPQIIGLGAQNLQIFNNLSAADQVAYNRTLLGENTDQTFALALEAEDFSQTGGCTRAAVEQVFDPEQLRATYRNPKDILVEQDSRVIAAIADWAECMREMGFNYDDPEQIEPDLEDRLEAITKGADPETLSAEAQTALTEFQGEERAIAVADYDCELKYIVPVVNLVETEVYGAPQN